MKKRTVTISDNSYVEMDVREYASNAAYDIFNRFFAPSIVSFSVNGQDEFNVVSEILETMKNKLKSTIS